MPRVKLIICWILVFCSTFPTIAADQAERLDAAALPLGDGKISSAPMRGTVYPCSTHFRGGGAQHSGDWLGSTTWDATRKIHVQGDVPWPDAKISIQAFSDARQIVGNGLPTNHSTGIFPVGASDPAYRIDRNPNPIKAQQISLNLPLSPEVAAEASCVPMGMIGITISGVAIFNALDDAGRDAVAHEVQDHCDGHPQKQGLYHYHGPSPCHAAQTENNMLVGYALDGFGIYSSHDEDGRELTNADLDECHGRTSRILWDGRELTMYHYVLTREYPYTLGCFRGRLPDGALPTQNRQVPDAPGMRPKHPPQEAVAACADKATDVDCGFVSPRGDNITGGCRLRGGQSVCVPDRMQERPRE